MNWVGQHELYYVQDEHKIVSSNYLKTIRARFIDAFLKSPDMKERRDILKSRDFLLDNILVDFSFHRENETFQNIDLANLNKNKWYTYKIKHNNMIISTKCISSIPYNGVNYFLEGLLLLSPLDLNRIPHCIVNSFKIQAQSISLESIFIPGYFSIDDIQLIHLFIFSTVFEVPKSSIFPHFFIFPFYTNHYMNDGNDMVSILSPCEVLLGLLNGSSAIKSIKDVTVNQLIFNRNNYPSVIRVDGIFQENEEFLHYCPIKTKLDVENFTKPINNFGDEYHQNSQYQFFKMNHLASKLKKYFRNMHIAVKNYFYTGLFTDISNYLLVYSILLHHIRFHLSLQYLEQYLQLTFKDHLLLECCLTHSSFRKSFVNFGYDYCVNEIFISKIYSLEQELDSSNPFSGKTSKRSQNQDFMIYSPGSNNERLEFLGDAVIEFITTLCLFHLFPDYTEGSLSIFRSAIVQNHHLSCLANKWNLVDFILIDPIFKLNRNSTQLKLICADALEALFSAILFEYSIFECQRCLGRLLWSDSSDLLEMWNNLPECPVITWAKFNKKKYSNNPIFAKLSIFEESIQIKFSYKHLLAKAFAHPSISFNSLTCGSNRTLEFLGDAILQFVVTKHLFLNVPQVEGILSSLRSEIVNNNNLFRKAVELRLHVYIISQSYDKATSSLLADAFESLVAAIFLDKGMEMVESFSNVIFFKSETGYSPSSPIFRILLHCKDNFPFKKMYYKTLKSKGPGNNMLQTIGLFLGSQLLGIGTGKTRKKSKIKAAEEALKYFNRT